mmetsp:Transcript_2901/g.6210  ORF Transcript_2901/g.6210 Transcript_2901/m.6210 type:complete len:121 (+) Transcript_2901:1912-2274(+)
MDRVVLIFNVLDECISYVVVWNNVQPIIFLGKCPTMASKLHHDTTLFWYTNAVPPAVTPRRAALRLPRPPLGMAVSFADMTCCCCCCWCLLSTITRSLLSVAIMLKASSSRESCESTEKQ